MTFAQSTTDAIRQEQIAEARRLADQEHEPVARRTTLHLAHPRAGSRTGTGHVEKKKNVLKGHEAFLKALEINGARIEVEKKDGILYRGVLKHTDKYTITLHVTEQGHVEDGEEFSLVEGRDRVIFKHDMSEFSALTPRQASTTTEGNE